MTRTVCVNGDYLPEGEAKVSVFDRGFLMADAVYEVTSVLDGRLIDFDGHMRRLERSLAELGMTCPMSATELLTMHRELVRLNRIDQGMIYLQVTRGNPGTGRSCFRMLRCRGRWWPSRRTFRTSRMPRRRRPGSR